MYKCSLCGSVGVTKATCPKNPIAKNQKLQTHYLANLLGGGKDYIRPLIEEETAFLKSLSERVSLGTGIGQELPLPKTGKRKKISNQINCENFRILNLIGAGAYGKVYKGCFDSICNYAVKIFPKIDKDNNKKEFERETQISNFAGQIGIAPKVKAWLICKKNGYLFTDLWEGSLDKIDWCQWKEEISEDLSEKLRLLHKNGYIHADISPRNILYQIPDPNQKPEIGLTDFGLSFSLDDPQTSMKTIKKWIRYLTLNKSMNKSKIKNLEKKFLKNPRNLDSWLLEQMILKCDS